MIVVVDYGMGNLRSVQKAFERLGHSVEVSGDPKRILTASHVVLPGVGAFTAGMRQLNERGLVSAIRVAIDRGTPFLGICLGMQLLMSESEEFGRHQGLGVIPGRVIGFPSGSSAMAGLKVPHMGWNIVDFRPGVPATSGLSDHAYYYFVHSFYAVPDDPAVVAGETTYGIRFASVLVKDHIVACQFHPEKSQSMGRLLLERFLTVSAASAHAPSS